MKKRASVIKETAKRYKDAGKKKKQIILNEYVKLTGFARKYAISKLNGCIKRREHIFNDVVIKTIKIENLKRKKTQIYFKLRYFCNLQNDEKEAILNYELQIYFCEGTESEKLKCQIYRCCAGTATDIKATVKSKNSTPTSI